jgi:FlaA1/EpsC-like NDP-sugar epimerase
MTLNQSINLIEETIEKSQSGEIWIPKIPAMKIIDLAEIFSSRFGSEIQVTGMRPGEKLHEDLVSEPESIRTRKLMNHYVIENPTKRFSNKQDSDLFSYASNQDLLTKEGLDSYLSELGIFEMEVKDFFGREIEEIRGRRK